MPSTPPSLAGDKPQTWVFELFPWNAPEEAVPIEVESKRVELSRKGHHRASFTAPTDDTTIIVEENRTDLSVRMNDGSEYIFRGRAGKVSENVGSTNATGSFPFNDYREVLRRRTFRKGFTRSFPRWGHFDIAWKAIEELQAVANGQGDYGIQRGLQIGDNTQRNWNPEIGDFVGEFIDQMSETASGFDWEIDGSMNLNMWSPSKSIIRGRELIYPDGDILSFTRTTNSGQFATHVHVSGDSSLDPMEKSSDNEATSIYGVWDSSRGYPDISNIETLQDRLDWELEQRAKILPSYAITLAPGSWSGVSSLDVGEIVRVKAKRGRIDDDFFGIVEEISISDDGDGDLSVSLKVDGV